MIAKAQAQMWAAHAAVLWEADPAVGRELGRLNLPDRGLEQPAEFYTLFIGDRRFEILNFRLMFPHKDDERNFRNSGDPGITDQLRVERFLSITAGRGLPVHEATKAIEFTYGVNVDNKLIGVGKVPDYPELKILLRLDAASGAS